MEISKDSWHFQFLKRWTNVDTYALEKKGTTLCSYFWRVVWELIAAAVACSFAATIIAAALALLIWAPVGAFILGIEGLVPAAIVGCSAWVFAGLTIAAETYKSRSYAKIPEPTKAPGLLVSYLSAKKAKFCPIVKVV